MILRKLECKSASMVMLGGVSLLVFRVWGQVLSPPTGGSASVKILSGVLCPSTTLRAAMSASSLCVTPVCDLALPMCVLYPMLFLMCMMFSASCRRCLWRWWMQLSGSMTYLRMVLMLKALSVNIERMWSSLLASSAIVIAANYARLIVCLSGWNFFKICVGVSSWVN
jgi:hypothetical protein